jgi:membrane protein DedA with SNARE-associated domain
LDELTSGHTLTHLIVTYGYWAILIGVAVDSFGVPLPGEAMLLTASVSAGATRQLVLPLVIMAAAAGGVIGDNLSYYLGRQGGTRLLQRFGSLVHLNRRRQLLAQYLFRRYGAPVVVIGRFIPIIHIATAVLAGVNAMSWRRFALYNGLGCLLWASLLGLAGFSLGQIAIEVDRAVLAFAVPGASVIAIGVLLLLRLFETRLQRQAEAVMAEPRGDAA